MQSNQNETQSRAATRRSQGQASNEIDLDSFPAWRRWAVRLTASPDFELLVLLVILGNVITLAMYDPLQDAESKWNSSLVHAELAFNIVFTIEQVRGDQPSLNICLVATCYLTFLVARRQCNRSRHACAGNCHAPPAIQPHLLPRSAAAAALMKM